MGEILALIFLIVVVTIIILGPGRRKRLVRRLQPLDTGFISQKWAEIGELLKAGKPSAATASLIEADKLLDYVLKNKIGAQGSMGERLKKARSLFSSREIYDCLWSAHKLRNQVVHEAETEIFHADIKKAVGSFERALKDLDLL